MIRRALATAVLAGTLAAPALAASSAPNLLKVLAAPIASAKRHGVKVLLPPTIEVDVAHVYGSGGATANGYDLQLGAVPGCNDANVCFVAEFTAATGTPISGGGVQLANALRGRYSPSVCGASCNPDAIRWTEYGHNYTIKYLGSRRALIALADAAISAGPR